MYKSKSKKIDDNYFSEVVTDFCESSLEIPGKHGRNNSPMQNAWLNLTVNYSLNFADSRNRVPGVIITEGDKCFAVDSNGRKFQIRDWDFKSQIEFNRKFKEGEKFWNGNFILMTPVAYPGLDFKAFDGR